MRLSRNPYVLTGFVLIFVGVCSTPVFLFLLEYASLSNPSPARPLTALGISVIILGIVCLGLARTRPEISPEASAVLLQAGVGNISALVEELGLRSKAIYLPSSKTSGRAQALIPLHSNPTLPEIRASLPNRLIARYGPNPEDTGILITTPGSATVAMLESRPGPTSAELESALSHILVGMLDLANGVMVGMAENRITAEISNQRMEYTPMLVYEYLGTPLASIVASVAAEALDKPIVVRSEQQKKGNTLVELEVLP